MSALDKVFRLHLIPRPQALVANDQWLIFSSFDIGLPQRNHRGEGRQSP
jgi:hypothetical protein